MHKFRAGIKTAALFTTLFIGSAHIAPAFAQANSIFPSGWDNNVRSRLFMRLGYTSTFLKTKSEEVRDITGPVATADSLRMALRTGLDMANACTGAAHTGGTGVVGAIRPGVAQTYSGDECDRYVRDGDASSAYTFAGGLLLGNGNNWDAADPNAYTGISPDGYFGATGTTGLGTPAGITARAQKFVGTPTISLGYWLDEERKWLLEGFVLAAPLSVKVYGEGYRADGSPMALNGQHLVTTKMLPPLVIGSYNFLDKDSAIRPYVGVGAMYAIFFDGRSTSFADEYMGGKTTVTTKNTFGFGPFVGLSAPISESWHFNVSVGQVALRATSRLATVGTKITSDSAVLQDITNSSSDPLANLQTLLGLGEDAWVQGGAGAPGFTTRLMELAARNNNQPNLGTYVREQKMKITSTIVTLSIGRSF